MKEAQPAELIASSRKVCHEQLMESAEAIEDVAHSQITVWPEHLKRRLLKCVIELRKVAETVK